MLSETETAALSLSLRVALTATAINLPLAFAAAWLLARRDFPLKSIVDGVIHLPLVLPPVAVGYGLLLLLGTNGPIGGWLKDMFGVRLAFSWFGAALAAAIMGFPLVVRAIRLSLDAVDPMLEHMARTLGAGRFRAFATITLPLALPGVLAGALLGFARSLGEFGATITFAANIPGLTQTLPLALYTATQQPGAETAALRLALLAVVLSIAALALGNWLDRGLRKRLGLVS